MAMNTNNMNHQEKLKHELQNEEDASKFESLISFLLGRLLRVAIGFLGNDGMGSEIRVFCINHNSLGDKFIRSFNEQVFRNSNTVVARSKRLLESLAVQK